MQSEYTNTQAQQEKVSGTSRGTLNSLKGRALSGPPKRLEMTPSSPNPPLESPSGHNLRPPASWRAVTWPPNRVSLCQRTPPVGYPATKGSPGGKLPAGNGALRSPV